ncbi:hypothetical protein GCM10023187_33370 [Nibrella viscosa]|uniref:Uncharacterized protein n=1 Tax=Nibrella viscosa TaxID=1084524 RepID=A0ABP8KLR5_9BACT
MRTTLDDLYFVITSRQPWEEKNLGSNIRDMARCLSQTYKVLFVNDPMDWAAAVSKKSGRAALRNEFLATHNGQHLIEVANNLWVLNPKSVLGSYNWLPDNFIYDWFNRQNASRLAAEIRSAVKQLNWPSVVLLNDNDMLQGFYLKELVKPALYVYYLRDNFLAVNYWKRHGERLEPALMQKVDLVASNSIYLTNQAARYNPNSVYIGQGCDLTLFKPASGDVAPADIARIPSPRIGYAGALTGLRLDGDLIEAIARRRPDWQVVLIGHADDSFPKERLDALPNITFLGSKKPADIPPYLAAMDVLINPQILNEVTIGNYPRKIDEYLAMGKPVVAFKTETMSLFENHVYLAGGIDQFITGIEEALTGQELSTPQARIAFAHEHTWENSVGALVSEITKRLAAQPQTT